MSLSSGMRVSPTVRLVRPLGRGGMGSVWVARHDALDTEVAVKFVAAEPAKKDPALLARFKREAALSAKIKSPHVVRIFDHGVMDDGRPYLVMELLAGETLGAYLARHERLSPRQAVTVVSQIAAVLNEAHALGVVHRDIKPDNVFLIDAGYDLFAKVLDFGIAKQTALPRVSEVTSTGAIVGTPEYMSPEQLLSAKGADHRSDLWSLGVLAYHALVGRVPFSGETLPSLSLAICNADYDPASEAQPELSPALDRWFERALAIEPAARFQAAGEMAEELGRILLGDEPPVESRPRPQGDADAEIISDPDADPQAVTEKALPPPAANPTPRAAGPASLSGAASELDASLARPGRRSVLWLALLLCCAAVVGVGSDLLLRRALSPRGVAEAPASGEPAGSSAPADEDGAGELSAETEPSDSTSAAVAAVPSDAASDAPAAPARSADLADAEASAAGRHSAAPVVPVASAARLPRPTAPSAKTKPGCENPYVLDKDGDTMIKPGCVQ